MTSILHALGISVEGGEVCPVLMDTLNPSLAGYKKNYLLLLFCHIDCVRFA
jgi:hypothetical protein